MAAFVCTLLHTLCVKCMFSFFGRRKYSFHRVEGAVTELRAQRGEEWRLYRHAFAPDLRPLAAAPSSAARRGRHGDGATRGERRRRARARA